MKRNAILAAMSLFVAVLLSGINSLAAPPATMLVGSSPVCSSVTSTGTKTAALGVSAQKTFEVNASTTAGTGTAALGIEGSLSGTTWSTIATTTMSIGTVTTAAIMSSNDRFSQVRCNVTTLSGSTPTLSVTMGF